MMIEKSFVRTVEDLVETVKVIARLFRSDEVFIIGSQSICFPGLMRLQRCEPQVK